MNTQVRPQAAKRSLLLAPIVRIFPGGGRALRKVLQTIVYAVIAAIVWETWFFEGVFQPLIVPGGSMAETLLGTHRTVVCGRCGYGFRVDSDVQPVSRRAVCPRCGFAANDLENIPDAAGDRVLVQKSVFFLRRPRAWEVVAFRDPGRSERIAVKRVVGLPGETITLRDGDVFADGRIRRKPLELQRAMAVAVVDHWVADADDAAWDRANGRFTHAAGQQTGSPDWLTFCPGRPLDNQSQEKQSPPGEWISEAVTDLSGYNQTLPRRNEDIHVVDDLMLRLRIAKLSGNAGEGKLFVRARDRQNEFLLAFGFEERKGDGAGRRAFEITVDVSRNGRPVNELGRHSLILPQGFPAGGVLLEVSLFDSCLIAAVDSQELIEYAFNANADESAVKQRDLRQPLALGSDGLGLVIDGLRVYRDVYYANAAALPRTNTNGVSVTLGADEYYVLGDNSPISLDSRNWKNTPGVSHKLLLGKPLVSHWPSRIVNVGGRDFQVPDIGRIRYIR